MLSNEQTTQTTRSYPMGQLADLMRDTLNEMKRQDDELQKKLNKVVETADKLVKETDKFLEMIEE